MSKKLRSIKDSDLELLIGCFEEAESHFSQKFLKMIIKLIKEKQGRFQLSTLINIVFAFSKIDFSFNEVLEVLLDIRDDSRLRESLGNLKQKS